ncbi:MAG: hypothetical protein ACI9YU_000324 [Flavobacteriales bacterium]|jgi:hypothetical protein
MILGAIWGIGLTLILGVIEPLILDTQVSRHVMHQALLWIPCGIVLAFLMHLYENHGKSKTKN